MDCQRQLNTNTNLRSKSAEKLNSGYQINRAADDAAGLAISEKMRIQIRGLHRGEQNIQEGISLAQVADGALAEVHDMLHRMNELAIQSANGTNSTSDRRAIQNEVDEIITEIDRIGKTTTFNGLYIFDDPGGFTGGGVGQFRYNIFHGSISKLIPCRSADLDYMIEALHVDASNSAQYGLSPGYYPAAVLDLSRLNASHMDLLHDKSFSFTCTVNCNEAFKFTFKTDGTPSGLVSGTRTGAIEHQYLVDISNCQNGQDVINELFTTVRNDPAERSAGNPLVDGGTYMGVSHSNYLSVTPDGNGLVVYSNTNRQNSAAAAASVFPDSSRPRMGRVVASDLASIAVGTYGSEEQRIIKTNDFYIHCSANTRDKAELKIHWMNAEILGVHKLNMMSEDNATACIDKIGWALAYLADERGQIGAYQNRLEHSYNQNCNTEENLQASESRIRDTDMAEEMVRFAKQNILEQAGVSMMAQLYKSNQNVLSLLTA